MGARPTYKRVGAHLKFIVLKRVLSLNRDNNNSDGKNPAAMPASTDELVAEFRAIDQQKNDVLTPEQQAYRIQQIQKAQQSQVQHSQMNSKVVGSAVNQANTNESIIVAPPADHLSQHASNIPLNHQGGQHRSPNVAASSEPVNMRTASDFTKAHKHSRWVKRFKLLLPLVAAVIVVGLIAFGLFYRQLPDNVSVDSAAISDGNLVMDSPNLDGFDDKDRPYSVKAKRAIQDLKNTDVIKLEGIQADLPIDDKNFAKVNAAKGIYDNKAQTLKLSEEIILNSSNGYVITLQEADIDVQKGTLISNAPISVESPNGNITAEALEIKDNGKRIVFKNKVKLIFQLPN
jgi:lipopolysaccharide export system protein LptC